MLQEKTINEELLEQSREALKNAGNRNIEIAGSASEEMRIVYEADDFSVSASGKNLRLGIRTLQDHRLGFVSTNSTSNAAIAEAVEESYSMARLSPPSEHYGFAEPGPNHVACQEFINEDSQLPHMSEQELVDVADRVIAAARNDPRIRLDRV
ncbi:MAG: hypothetical protein KDK23_16135, partial [Leptospiraceae bacterium]|nr:hypothetical protein [Leptospiraceae bacterium]